MTTCFSHRCDNVLGSNDFKDEGCAYDSSIRVGYRGTELFANKGSGVQEDSGCRSQGTLQLDSGVKGAQGLEGVGVNECKVPLTEMFSENMECRTAEKVWDTTPQLSKVASA
ncbi:hypothetical protein HispidOSU_023771 [Sigmodon hispidus]